MAGRHQWRRHSGFDAGWASAAVALGAMIATPLVAQGGRARRVLSPVVVSGLAATTSHAAARRWGGGRTVAALATVVTGTGLVEGVGSRSGFPFGRYTYTDRLRPQVAGVPAVVPLAWWAMALPAREVAVAALGRRATPTRRAVVGATALTAWDLFLDPQMVGEGFWTWARRGRYRGIPASNFVGWFVTGVAVMAALDVLLPPAPIPPDADVTSSVSSSVARGDRSRHGSRGDAGVAGSVSSSVARGDRSRHGACRGAGADPVLVGEYTTMAVMETLGFAAFFRDRLVATVGGAAMVPIAATAVVRLLREGRRG